MEDKYYGPKKVVSLEDVDDNLLLKFNDDTSCVLSSKMAKVTLTDKPDKDLSKLRDIRVQPVAAEILRIMMEWNVKLSEVEHINALVITSLNDNVENAAAMLWGSSSNERVMSEVNNVLKNNGKIKS